MEAGRGWRIKVPKDRDRQLWRDRLEQKPSRLQVIPRRRVIERTFFAWLSRSRRLASDDEHSPGTGKPMIDTAMSRTCCAA